MKSMRIFNRWEQVFAWLPVAIVEEDRTTTVWLEHYWRCRLRFGPIEYSARSLQMPRPDASRCDAHKAAGIALDPFCPACEAPSQDGESADDLLTIDRAVSDACLDLGERIIDRLRRHARETKA